MSSSAEGSKDFEEQTGVNKAKQDVELQGQAEGQSLAQRAAGASKTVRDTAARAEEPPQPSGSLGGWGWLPSAASLQQAAAGALRDVRELQETFQQVLCKIMMPLSSIATLQCM